MIYLSCLPPRGRAAPSAGATQFYAQPGSGSVSGPAQIERARQKKMPLCCLWFFLYDCTRANGLSYIQQTSGTINRHDFIKWVKPTPDKSDTQLERFRHPLYL